MELISNENIDYLTFKSFENTGLVVHAFSTRNGGVSSGCFKSMNLWFAAVNGVGLPQYDTLENLTENLSRFSISVGFNMNNTVFSDQIHETQLYRATEADCGKGLGASDIKAVDGLLTNAKNVVLTTFYADCVPLFFLDPVKKAIALSHAGWKGSVKGMARTTIERMKKEFNSNPADILAGIGPSIGKCCFEVDEPVVKEFLGNLDFSEQYILKAETKFFIDLKQINKQMLINCGLNEANIEIAQYCTKCNPQLFYSHRAMGRQRGQMAAFLKLI